MRLVPFYTSTTGKREIHMGKNDRSNLLDDDDIEDTTVSDGIGSDHDPDYDDILENPGDYDEDGERGYWADL